MAMDFKHYGGGPAGGQSTGLGGRIYRIVENYSATKGVWRTTQHILTDLGFDTKKIHTVRKILHRFVEKGVIQQREQSGKHWWRLADGTTQAKGSAASAEVEKEHDHEEKEEQKNGKPANVKHLEDAILELTTEVRELREQLEHNVKRIEVVTPENKLVTILKDVVLPKEYNTILDLCQMRMNVLLVGPAGCGKTHLSELVAKTLDLDFEAVSCTSGMSETQLTGRVRPKLTGDDLFQTTGFLEMYENGGVFLFDEFDAADGNLSLVVNTALANNYCNVPNRDENRRAKRHKDFIAIATANTYGRGATRMYAGRNQLDEATLDRFRIGLVECDYDLAVEKALCPDDRLREKLQAIRTKIEANPIRRIMSTRFMRDAYVMKKGKSWTDERILDTYFQGWTKDEKAKVL